MENEGISDTYREIFYQLQAICADSTFVDAQVDFMKANMGTFDENEENKLEYMSIFESYVMSMEDLIDAKLNEKYANE